MRLMGLPPLLRAAGQSVVELVAIGSSPASANPCRQQFPSPQAVPRAPSGASARNPPESVRPHPKQSFDLGSIMQTAIHGVFFAHVGSVKRFYLPAASAPVYKPGPRAHDRFVARPPPLVVGGKRLQFPVASGGASSAIGANADITRLRREGDDDFGADPQLGFQRKTWPPCMSIRLLAIGRPRPAPLLRRLDRIGALGRTRPARSGFRLPRCRSRYPSR